MLGLLLLGLLMGSLPPDPLSAQPAVPREFSYDWPDVPGARGYAVEIRDKQGTIVLRENTDESRITLGLPPGEYEHRLAALNKFRKPGRFSPWVPFVVRLSLVPELERITPARVLIPLTGSVPAGPGSSVQLKVTGRHFVPDTQVTMESATGPVAASVRFVNPRELLVTLSRQGLQPGELTVRLENPGGKLAARRLRLPVERGTSDSGGGAIKPMQKDPVRQISSRERRIAMARRALVPGMGAWQRGDPLEFSVWAGLYAGYAAAGVSENRAASKTAADANGPQFTALANPALLLNIGSAAIVAGDQNQLNLLLGTSLFLLQEQSRLKAKYAQHQQNQAAIGGLAVLTYVAHVYGESFLGWDWRKLLPGLPHWQHEQRWAAVFWGGSFLALAGGAYGASRVANTEARSIKNDPVLTLAANPATATLFASRYFGRGSSAEFNFVALLNVSLAKRTAAKAAYEEALTAQYALGAGAVVLAIAYLVALPDPAAPPKAASKLPGEAQSAGPLFSHGPDDRGQTQTRFGWQFVF